MRRPTEAANAPVETVLVAAASAALVVAAAAFGGARPLVVASFAMSSFLVVAGWSSWLLRREYRARLAAEARADSLVAGLRSALGGGEEAPVETGVESLDRLVSAVLEQQCDAAERAIESDIRVLEFDHVRGEKSGNISEMIASGHSIARLQTEIEKCDVVCANCHRIRTGDRGGWFRNRHVNFMGDEELESPAASM